MWRLKVWVVSVYLWAISFCYWDTKISTKYFVRLRNLLYVLNYFWPNLRRQTVFGFQRGKQSETFSFSRNFSVCIYLLTIPSSWPTISLYTIIWPHNIVSDVHLLSLHLKRGMGKGGLLRDTGLFFNFHDQWKYEIKTPWAVNFLLFAIGESQSLSDFSFFVRYF